MEEWEKILENYEVHSDSKAFNTIIRSAKNALDEDLAPFESDWIFSTLIKKPVNLLVVVAEHRMNDEYNKCIVEALKLLGDAVDRYDNFEKYYEEVSELCLLQYPAVPRQQALCCLTRVARRDPCASRGLQGHLTALQQGVCMAPLAVLIGTICEHQPHVVADDVVNIWRVFLNLLDSNKYSGTVMKAVLQGILGLFKNFGDDLPTMELIKFYERLVALLEVNSCHEVCLAILTHHARLFFTCVTRDACTRELLWRLNAFEALQAVYAVCDEAVLKEVKTYISSPNHRARGVARRLLGVVGGTGGDAHDLEAELRSGGGGPELGDKISWSIQTNPRSNHRLLQAAMLFYDSFPPSARTDILLAILNSKTHVLNAAITFLIAEITRNQKLTIWQDILKYDTEKLKIVYDNVNKYINIILERVVEGLEGPPLSSLLPLLVSLPPRVCLRCPLRVVLRASDTTDTTILLAAFSGHPNISIDDCMEDEVKIKCSLVVLYRMDEQTFPVQVSLAALQTIFSTKSMEATIISEAVRALETLVQDQRVDECVLDEIIHNLEKIRKRTDKTKKADRILYRDIFMFVGKHRKTEYNDNDLNSLIVDLKNTLTLQIPHEAGTLKMSLDGVLCSALQLEDEDALNVLTSVICVNLSSGRAACLQRALLRVCACVCARVCASAAHAHTLAAVRVCDAVCAEPLLQYIIKEKSSESRKILLEGLEILIRKDADGRVLENIVENIIYTEDQRCTPSYIHILDTIINLLKDNNSVCLKLLPGFLIKVLKTPKSEQIVNNAYNLFTDKMYIYDDSTLNSIVKEIIKILDVEKNTIKNNITLDFVKNILSKTNKNINDFIENAEDLKLFVSMKRCFHFDVTLNTLVVERVRDKLFVISSDLESVLMFLETFSDILLEKEYERTIYLLSQIIENLTSQDISDNAKCITKCMKSLKNRLRVTPEKITCSIEQNIKKININELSESVEKNGFNSDNELTIHAIKVMIEALDGSILSGFDSFIVSWKDMFHKLYNSGYVKICLESKIEVLSDLTFVALKFMSEDEIKCVILQGPDDFGTSFTGSLISVFFPHLSATLLMGCSTLLHQALTHTRGGRGDLTHLVDQIWPYYEKETTFRQKQLFLLDYLPHSPADSEPLKWVISTLNSDTDVENKLMILDVLPKGDTYGPLPLVLLPLLPSRLSELEGSSSDCFRAILDALATNMHTGVLEAVATLAANDPTAGWWDSALSACMSGVSREGEGGVRLVWEACERAGMGAFERLMIPLLRQSKSSVIESFVSSIVEELLSSLRRTPRDGCAPRGVRAHLMEHVRAFNVLEIVFQRVPREHIESPGSALYRRMSAATPFQLVSLACKLCVSLRARAAPRGLEEEHRLSLVANYRCLSAALLCRRPRPHVYGSVVDPEVWSALLDPREEPRASTPRPRQSVTRHAASTSSVRTRVFLRTLSENPLAYDLMEEEEEEEEIMSEESELPDGPLDGHSCLPAVTALLGELGGGGGAGAELLVEGVTKALEGEPPLASFIAQAACGARAALRGAAARLAPALCALLRGRLRDLHLHVLDAVIFWRCEFPEAAALTQAMEFLICTAVERGRTDGLYGIILNKLTKLLDIYGKIVSIRWACFEKYFKDPKSKSFEMCLRILNRINIYIPELLPALSLHLERRVTLLWSVYGKALRATHERGGGEGELRRFRSVLEALRRSDTAEYVKALYYVQREHPAACDQHHYRVIADLVPKIPRRERPKCLSILSAYIERCGDAHGMLETLDLTEEMDTVQGLELARVSLPLMSPPLRALVCDVAGSLRGRGTLAEAAYRLLLRDFELNTQTEPSTKRRTLVPHPHIYTAVGVARGLEGPREGVRGLSTDLGVRFCECFILCVVVPLTHNLKVNMAAILELFFQEIRQQEVFKNAKLSEDTFEFRTPSHARTISAAGTPQTPAAAAAAAAAAAGSSGTSLEDVLDSIIKFSRRDERACTAIVIQLIRALGATRPGFDFHHTMSQNIVKCIKIGPAAAGLLEAAREAHAWPDLGMDEVKHLVHRMRNSEGEGASRALYEELLARREREVVLGITAAKEEDMPEVSENFSMGGLVSAFGALSDWGALRRAQPPLWAPARALRRAVDEYDFEDAPLWLRAVVSRYRGDDIHSYKILKDLDVWPRRHFDIAAVLECGAPAGGWLAPARVPEGGCLAQWAARIMLGSLYAGDCYAPSRSLSWCERGNEMALYEQVVACCGSVSPSEESALVKFTYQEMLALRGMALQRGDGAALGALLKRAESYNPLETKSNFVDMLGMNELTLLLRRDMNSLERIHVDSVLRYLKQNASCSFRTESVSTICVLGMTLYDKQFAESTDAEEQSSLLLSMCDLVGLHGGLALPWSPLMSDVLLHALEQYRGDSLDEVVAAVVLSTLHPIINNLDECSLNQLQSNEHLFPEHGLLRELHQNELSLDKYKQCLSLVCDPAHLLRRYCARLLRQLDRNDESQYKEILMKMSRQVFENPYSGADYRELLRYGARLKEIHDFATNKQTIKQVLINIQAELVSKRDTLCLSDVCPTLSREKESESLNKLLGLKRGVRVVKFEEKVSVYTGAVSRPVLLSFLCSDGLTRRCIVKREGGGHAAVVRARSAVGGVGGARRGYTVNTISDECLLIEYLERHTPLRDLVTSACPIDASARASAADPIAAPGAARARYDARCDVTPATALRSAIEARCATFQDFLYKKKNFQESVCWMTILNFLFGLSDRHLENILYSSGDGGACDVDCGDLSAGEIPPARLTRNILGVCDVTALESSLQRKLSKIREHQGIIVPSIKMAFKSTENKYRDKIPFIRGKMQGSLLPHQVSRETFLNSRLPHRDKYIALLDQIFGTDTKTEYSVEEQISSLLLQCTDPRILSVTRPGWEPWI